MNSLFITGSTGFIGRRFITQLRAEGYDKIFCLLRSERNQPLFPQSCEFVRGDIRRPDSYAAILEKCRTVVHLAAATGKAKPKEYFETNAEGTKLLVKQCEQKGVKNFLLVSTISVKYQSKKNYYYAESKEAAEEAVIGSSLQYTIVRPTIVLGKESPSWKKLSGLVTRWIVFVPGTGRVMMQPVDVDDLCSFLNSILQEDRFLGEIIEFGGPDQLTFQDFIEKVHGCIYGGRHAVLKIPIKPILPMLSFFEKIVPSIPLSAGQLSAFLNDGTVDPIRSVQPGRLKMKGIDQLLQELTANA